MTPNSAIVFSVFGGLWVVFAILSQQASQPVLCLIPVAIAGLLVMWSISVVRTLAQLGPHEKKRRDRIIMVATGLEGVVFFVGIMCSIIWA